MTLFWFALSLLGFWGSHTTHEGGGQSLTLFWSALSLLGFWGSHSTHEGARDEKIF